MNSDNFFRVASDSKINLFNVFTFNFNLHRYSFLCIASMDQSANSDTYLKKPKIQQNWHHLVIGRVIPLDEFRKRVRMWRYVVLVNLYHCKVSDFLCRYCDTRKQKNHCLRGGSKSWWQVFRLSRHGATLRSSLKVICALLIQC